MRGSWAIALVVGCSGPEAPPGTLETLSLTNNSTGRTYGIEVFTPAVLDDAAGAPVVYIFDGPENQATVLGEYKLALDDGATPAVLALIPGTQRVNDYTPTPNDRGTAGGEQIEFMAFITQQVAPEVEASGAGGAPENRIVFGHSLGGLLSGTFWYDVPFASRAGIASPSLWWDGGLFFSKLGQVPANQGAIVVTCGEEEPMGMAVYTQDFAEQMEADYGVEATYACFRNKSHQSALEPALGLAFTELLR